MALFFLGFALLVGCHTTTPTEDPALRRAILETIEETLRSDDLPDYRTFTRRAFHDIYSCDDRWDCPRCDDDLYRPLCQSSHTSSAERAYPDWWYQFIDYQLPPGALSLPPEQPVAILLFEFCNRLAVYDDYGLLDWTNTGLDIGEWERARINLAFEFAKIHKRLSFTEYWDLFDGVRFVSVPNYSFPVWLGLQDLNADLFMRFKRREFAIPHLAIIYQSDECGAGEFFAKIKTDPLITSAYIIPDFFFSVCSKRFPDPYEITRCPWWDSAPDTGVISGVYHWQGWLASGERRTGRVNVDLSYDSVDTPEIILR